MLGWPSLPPLNAEGLGIWVAALLTLAVLSAAFVESQVSRAMFGVLVGAAAGYAAAVTLRAVLWPRLLLILRNPFAEWTLLFWFLLGLLLLARGLSSVSWLGDLPLAYLIGVGAALAIGGAVLGTAVPQLMAVAAGRGAIARGSWLAVANVLLVALGTGGVLFRFTYTGLGGESPSARLWTRLARSWGRAGNAFLVVAFAALFATAIVSLVTLLASRLHFLLADWLHIVP